MPIKRTEIIVSRFWKTLESDGFMGSAILLKEACFGTSL
jgi:hypothetical protein